jgi:hypothetical protein|nr:MAG TPA: hypothetical protein [Caudoviricetes sp.]
MNLCKLLDVIMAILGIIGGSMLLLVGPENFMNYRDLFLRLVWSIYLIRIIKYLYIKGKKK